MDPSSPTLISFCTGYAGLELGIERALGRPCRVLAYSEIEAFAIENLAAKVQAGFLPPAPIWSDLRSFPGKAFHGMVDILCGGYPCQGFSLAGKRLGKADPRHLWPFFRAQIRAIHPRVVFFENVEGHVSLGLSTVLSDLEEDGYKATWGLFSAAEVGAPHRRKRVFILGYAKGDDERGFPFPPVYREGVTAGGSGCDGVADPGGEGLPDPLRGDRAGSGGRETPAGSPAGRGAVRDPLLSEGRVWAILAPDPGWPSRPGEPQYGWEPPRTVADAAGLQFCGVAPAGADPAGHPGPGAVSGQPAVLGVPPRELHDRGGEPGAAGGREPPDAGEGETEPPLGGDPDGPSYRLDYALLCRSWDSRIDELRLLGNGVVPATAERAFRVLSAELCGLDVSDPAVLREIIGQGAPAITGNGFDPPASF